MKKFLARFAIIGMFAAMVASSYALPASAATASNPGATTDDTIIIIIIGDDYLVLWVELDAEVASVNPGTLSAAVSDQMFDQ